MKKTSIISIFVLFAGLAFTTSCEDMMPDDSSRVIFEKDHQLDEPNDSLYSLWGIIQKVQLIADRYVLLGEVRADLLDVNSTYATTDIRALSNYDYTAISDTAEFNRIRDYYAVINNCNYYIAHVDTSYTSYNPIEAKPLLREYAAVKGIRAWTYMQLALTYGKIPFYLHPLTTLDEVNEVYNDESLKLTLEEITPKLLEDLSGVVDVDLPSWNITWKENENDDNSASTTYNARKMLFPIRLLMGDLYLLQNNYEAAAMQYYQLIEKEELELRGGDRNYIQWGTAEGSWSWVGYMNMFVNASALFEYEMITSVPTLSSSELGFVSDLRPMFGSFRELFSLQELTPSASWSSLCLQQLNGSWNSTSKIPTFNTKGDARANMYITKHLNDAMSGIAGIETFNVNYKYESFSSSASTGSISIYRVAHLYLRFAEAINRMGYPETAFAVLKYGLNATAMTPGLGYISDNEITTFPYATYFQENETLLNDGIHTRGCFGESLQNIDAYKIPECANATDSIAAVEEMLLDEMALETCFEGSRMADLMRIGKHREAETGVNTNEFVATKIARRSNPEMTDAEVQASTIYKKLSTSQGNSYAEGNYFYLPIK